MTTNDGEARAGGTGVDADDLVGTSAETSVPGPGDGVGAPEQSSWDRLRAEVDEKAEEAGRDEGADQDGGAPQPSRRPDFGMAG